MKVLVTGAAGFIGMHVSQLLLRRGDAVLGLDNLNSYYDPQLKRDRLARLTPQPGFRFVQLDVADRAGLEILFADERFEAVVHLAAQAGVRYSVANPHAYIDSNIVGFANVLEGCRHNKVGHLVYASSSSVYGGNTRLPFSEHHNVDRPVSLYAATKKANELMAHSYAHLFGLACTGLRFFTVYGPWGRPDMALFRFTKNILEGRPIQVFNNGNLVRDFTYIDDIVDGVVRTLDRPPPGTMPYRIYNIGNHRAVELMHFIDVLQRCLASRAQIEMLPMQAGDVQATVADVSALEAAVGYRARTPVEVGVSRFVDWYRSFYGGRGMAQVGQAA